MEITKADIKRIIKEVQENPNNKLKAAVYAMYEDRETPEQRLMVMGAAETLEAWFDLRKLAREKLNETVVNAFKGHLRVSRSGGASTRETDIALAYFATFVERDDFANALLPFLQETVRPRDFMSNVKREYIVKGGIYTDTSFLELIEGTEEEYGPFDHYCEAFSKWSGASRQKIDICCHRLFIEQV